MRPFKSLLALAAVSMLSLCLAAPAEATWGFFRPLRRDDDFRAGFRAGQRQQFRDDFRQFNGHGFRAGFSFGY